MSAKTKFKLKDEKKMIKFIKSHDILYNVNNRRFCDTEAKKRLWLQLASEMDKDVDVVINKWQSLRDYFIRFKQKNKPGTTAMVELLSFLNETSILYKYSIDKITTDLGPSIDPDTQPQVHKKSNADKNDDLAATSEMNKILRETLDSRPKPSAFKIKDPTVEFHSYFKSMVSTMSHFPPATIARIKLEISQMIFQEEIAWAKQMQML